MKKLITIFTLAFILPFSTLQAQTIPAKTGVFEGVTILTLDSPNGTPHDEFLRVPFNQNIVEYTIWKRWDSPEKNTLLADNGDGTPTAGDLGHAYIESMNLRHEGYWEITAYDKSGNDVGILYIHIIELDKTNNNDNEQPNNEYTDSINQVRDAIKQVEQTISNKIDEQNSILEDIKQQLQDIKQQLTTTEPIPTFDSLPDVNYIEPEQPQTSFTDNNTYFSDSGHNHNNDSIPNDQTIKDWSYNGVDLSITNDSIPEPELSSDNELIQDNQLTKDNQLIKQNEPNKDNEPIKDNELSQDNQLIKDSEPVKDNELSQNNQLNKQPEFSQSNSLTKTPELTQDNFVKSPELNADSFVQTERFEQTNVFEQSNVLTENSTDNNLRWKSINGVKQ